MQHNLWAVILAGGEGQRMTPFVRSWLGHRRPKQYCTFVGTRSMLQHTIDRTVKVVDPNRIVTVIGDSHLTYLWESLSHEMEGRILQQPRAAGTGAGIILAVTYVLAAHPDATFLILPSDHFFYPESLLSGELNQMVRIAETFDDRLVLLGAKADRPEQDYGWIEPGNSLDDGVKRVKTFWEKPGPEQARKFLDEGYLWNTMVMAARGRVLWRLGNRFFPGMMHKFETLHALLRAIYTGNVGFQGLDSAQLDVSPVSLLADACRDVAPADFSGEVLQGAQEETLVLEMNSKLQWSDWGRPARVWESLKHINKTPAFPRALAFPQPTASSRSGDTPYIRV